MDFNDYRFTCPHCNATLNTHDEIELLTVRKSGEEGRIYLSVSVGNYTYRHMPKTDFTFGEVVEFLCPKCKVNLAAPQHKNFALLNMAVANNINFEVIFSREAGKRKTYLITEDGIETYQG